MGSWSNTNALAIRSRAAGNAYFKVEVKKQGRFREPKLDHAQLTKIGNAMVEAQLARWSKGVNAYGQPAKPLSKRYFFVKKYVTGQWRPVRDNKLTGALVKNFTLRKAIDGVISAEPTQRLTREASLRAEKYDHMTGFADSDVQVVYRGVVEGFQKYAVNAWKTVDGNA